MEKKYFEVKKKIFMEGCKAVKPISGDCSAKKMLKKSQSAKRKFNQSNIVKN